MATSRWRGGGRPVGGKSGGGGGLREGGGEWLWSDEAGGDVELVW